MKVVFPCNGSLVLQKQDLETLKDFYRTNLLTSQMAEMYAHATTIIQIKKFNYIPKTNSVVLYNANVLTIEKMRKILGISHDKEKNHASAVTPTQPKKDNENKDYIYDDDLLSNPFFTTLTPLN